MDIITSPQFIALFVVYGIISYFIYRLEERNKKEKLLQQMNNPMSAFHQPPDWPERRAYVLNRDYHKCTKCGKTTDLHVHHIIPRAERYDHSANNLITLCHECHGRIHGIKFTTYARRELMIEIRARFFGHSKIVLARKNHSCNYCSKTIMSNNHYYKIQGSVFTFTSRGTLIGDSAKICEQCAEKLRAR